MAQLENIEAIEKRLWSAADQLRANSNYASNEYFLPVMGLVFLRHAYSRYLMVKEKIEPNLPSRGGKTRSLSKEDFSQQSAIFLQPEAQFDYLVRVARCSQNGGLVVVRRHRQDGGQERPLISVRPQVSIDEHTESLLARCFLQWQRDQIAETAFGHRILIGE